MNSPRLFVGLLLLGVSVGAPAQTFPAAPQATPFDQNTPFSTPASTSRQPLTPEQALLQAQAASLAQGAAPSSPEGVQGMTPQNQMGPQSPATAAVADAPAAPTKPPLDADFGLLEERALWDFDPSQTLRQQGGSLPRPPHRGLFHSKSGGDQVLLQKWMYDLTNAGVSKEKVLFEARRLSREDFERWASRFVWWEEALHPNVVVPQH